MENEEYAVACTEVLEVLNYISKEDYNKVPKEVIQVLEKNKKDDIVFLYNPWKDINEQGMSETGRIMLASFFRDYWATPEQRKKIQAKEKYDREKIEEEKRAKYNSDIFKTKENDNSKEAINNSNLPIEVKKERFYEKIINFFKSFFR